MTFEQKKQLFLDMVMKQVPFIGVDEDTKLGLKNILDNLFTDLYQNFPSDFINFQQGNISNKFMDLYFREQGIFEKDVKKIPEVFKPRLFQIIETMNLHIGAKKIFKCFHEVIEDYFPTLNIYSIDVVYEEDELKFKLRPQYISDEDNVEEYVQETFISTNFLMNINQFLDKENKPSNLFPSEKDKRRNVNIFPIKTSILHFQTGTKINSGTKDTLRKMIGATESSERKIPIRLQVFSKVQWANFNEAMDILNYIKYKELEFNSTYLYKVKTFWKWKQYPFFKYTNEELYKKLIEKQKETSISWKQFFKWEPEKITPLVLTEEMLVEARSLLNVYNGLEHDYDQHQDFKLRFDKLRQYDLNQRDIHQNIDSLRRKLYGINPKNFRQLRQELLFDFKTGNYGKTRDDFTYIKNIHSFTNETNAKEFIDTLVKWKVETETQQFLKQFKQFGGEIDLTPMKLDELEEKLYLWYADGNFIPAINQQVKLLHENFQYELTQVNTELILKEYIIVLEKNNLFKLNLVWNELIDYIDEETQKNLDFINSGTTDTSKINHAKTWFSRTLMELQKTIIVDLSDTDEMKYFWNDTFQRLIFGGALKDFVFDPIVYLFHEYWFSADTSSQNKDIQKVLQKDKLDSVVLGSKNKILLKKNVYDNLNYDDMVKISKSKTTTTETNEKVVTVTVLRDDLKESPRTVIEETQVVNFK